MTDPVVGLDLLWESDPVVGLIRVVSLTQPSNGGVKGTQYTTMTTIVLA